VSEFPLRDYLIGKLLEIDALEAEHAMNKVHKRFNTALGFPVVLCAPRLGSLVDRFKPWQKTAQMTNNASEVTCGNCKKKWQEISR